MKRIINKLEIDNALLWVLSNKLWSILKGPISLFFIISYLSPEDQGLWYTFLSLGALTVFAEMGFTAIITQFVSHEYAHLKERNGFLTGKMQARDRLVSLVRYALKFYLFVIPFAIIVLYGVGKYFLVNVSSDVFLLWMIFSVTGGIQLLVSLLQSIIQGFDKVALVQKNIFVGSLVLPLTSWTMLYFGFGIATLVIANILSIILMLFLFYKSTKKFYFQIYRQKVFKKYNWFNEIVKLQCRYAVSWMAGYFIFQFMTPMIYKHEGAILAGQFGMTLGLIKIISGISGSWLETKVPKMNMLVAHRDKAGLDSMFYRNAMVGFFVFSMITISFLFTIYLLNICDFYAERFLSLYLASLLILLEIPNVVTGYLAKYLRSHKSEPYYAISVLMGVLYFGIISLMSLKLFELSEIIIILNIVSWLIILPLAVVIFKNFNLNYYKGKK